VFRNEAPLMDDFLRRLFGGTDRPHPLERGDFAPDFGPEADPATLPTPVTRKVLMITHNPVLRTQRGKTVREHFGWNDSAMLARGYIDDVRYASYGYANYEVVEHLEVDAFPVKRDGFRYDEATYLKAWARRTFHDPDGVDYHALVDEFRMLERVDSGDIDEVWLFGHPYGGYWESIMAGPGAFWCNAPPLTGTGHASRRFVIMGFNFERGVGEMLEDLGHRVESIMNKVYEPLHGDANLFERFTRYDRRHPGRAEVGNVHFAPNSERDYDWGNPRVVPSRHHTWWRFPDLSGEARPVNATVWGGGDIRQHHVWWLRHLPHVTGETNGVAHNWWQYVIDPNVVEP
jgi:hypothetical protein